MCDLSVAVTGANSSVGTALLTRLLGQGDIRVVAGVRSIKALEGLPRSP